MRLIRSGAWAAVVVALGGVVPCASGATPWDRGGTDRDVIPVVSSVSQPSGLGIPHPMDGGVAFTAPGVTLAADRLLIRFRPAASQAVEARIRQSVGASLLRDYHLVPGLQLLRVESGSVLSSVAALSRNPEVQYVVPDLSVGLQAVPNDPRYGQQWAMGSIGAPAAWDRATGSGSIAVGVLDTGIQLTHEDLTPNLWTNDKEIAGNGIDDDGNGYVDDVVGWNFVANTNNPSDDTGHGTHVSGIVGAAGNNAIGVTGVNWHVGLMPLKVCDSSGSCSLSAEISALQYAVDEGAKVVNASFGGFYGGNQAEEDAIAAAGAAGVLYVASAGNESNNNDNYPAYPASYPLDNILAVAATDSSDGLAYFSNYGATTVDLGAPGVSILNTLPKSGPLSNPTGYGMQSGTSMAAPHVAGAAALLWTLHPEWTMAHVRARLVSSVRPLSSLAGRVASCGALDIDAATDPAAPDRALVCVARIGSGSGSVSSTPAGISCGSVCSGSFSPGTQVTLTPAPSPESTFAGWLGACSGSGTCTVNATSAATVTAIFRTPGSPAGWSQARLAPPANTDPFPNGSSPGYSFFNISIAADGSERAKSAYHLPGASGGGAYCYYNSTDTGGVFLERKTSSGWVADGSITAPALGSVQPTRWANCAAFGTVTELSADGSTLLVSPNMAPTVSGYRCVAFVYKRGAGGWALDGTLFPPGVTANGGTYDTCFYFGIGGAISNDGTRVAVLSSQRADLFVRGSAGWALEQHIALPAGSGCGHTIAPRYLALSGDGRMLLVADPGCDSGGQVAVGRVYAYARNGSTWSLPQTIDPPEQGFQNEFGHSVALSDDGATATLALYDRSSLPLFAGAAWVFEQDEQGWHARTRLTATSPEERTEFTCPTILGNGARILCGAFDTIGFDSAQGSLYAFNRPAGGWASQSAPAVRAFATEGFPSDALGRTGDYGWADFAATADGSLVDATIAATNIANGLYAHDRIGYEFTAPALSPPTAVTLRSFRTTRTPAGVLLRWRTASETGLLGFNLYRRKQGRLVRLNRTLIPGVFAGTTTGHAYRWLHRGAQSRAEYRLQAVNLDGTKRWLGTARTGR